MIISSILSFLINLLLAPLTVVDIAIDFFSGIEWVTDALSIVAYIMPWSNILPIVAIIVGLFIFRITISIIKTLWELIPIA